MQLLVHLFWEKQVSTGKDEERRGRSSTLLTDNKEKKVELLSETLLMMFAYEVAHRL